MFAKNKDIVKRVSFDIDGIKRLRHSARSHAFERRKERVDTINTSRNNQEIKIGDLVYVRSNDVGKLVPKVHESPVKVI